MIFKRLIPLGFVAAAALSFAPPSFAQSTTTATAAKSPASTAAPAAKSSKKAKAKSKKAKSTTVKSAAGTATSTKAKAPVRAGNFCKKTLVGTTSPNTSGTVLTCKADAKGQPRWTK